MKRRTCSKSWKRSSHCASCDKSNARTSFICTRTAQHNTRSLVGALADRPTDYAMLCSKCSPPLNCAARRCAREPLACCPLYTLCARRVLRRSPETRRADAAAPRVRRRGGLVRGGRCGDSLCAFASSIAPPLNKCPQLNSSQLLSTQLGAASALRHNLRAVRRSSRLDSSVVSLQPSDPFVLLCGARRTRQKPE